MIDIKNFIRDDLKQLEPYKTHDKPYKIKINANESPFKLSDNLKNKLIEYIKNDKFNLYPDSDSTELREKIAEFYNVDSGNVICGVGSDQIIDLIDRTFLNKGDKCALISPTFSMYYLTARLNYGDIVEIRTDKNFYISPDEIIKKVNETNSKILYLCTPNNPTGNTFRTAEIIKIIENTNCLIVIDEAYGEFSASSMVDYINLYNNIIVLKTFSKAFGLAGLRVGYAIASKEIIEALNICKPPFNLSAFSQFAALQVLNEYEIYKNKIETLKRNREFFYEELKNFKFLYLYESGANFVLLDSEKEITDFLERNGILVRRLDFNAYGNYKERLRISIGTRKDMEEVIEILKRVQ